MKISIIICTYNRASLLLDSLNSLISGNASKELFEIIVIDNNSVDETKLVAESFMAHNTEYSISYYKETQQGLSYARNRGIEEARYDLVAFFDDDIIAGENLIQNWLQFFNLHPHAIGGGGKIHVQFDSPRPNWMPEILLSLFGKHDYGSKVKKYSWGHYPFGGNLVYKKEVFEKLGGFKTELGRKGKELNGGEEKELYHRVSEYNDSIFYVPNAFLWHRVGVERLNKEYVLGQAKGVGKSIAIMLESSSFATKLKKISFEVIKLFISLMLFFGYLFLGKTETGKFILQFRQSVWNGYLTAQKNNG